MAMKGSSHERYQKWTMGEKRMSPPREKLRLIQNLFLMQSQNPILQEMRKRSAQSLLVSSLGRFRTSTRNWLIGALNLKLAPKFMSPFAIWIVSW